MIKTTITDLFRGIYAEFPTGSVNMKKIILSYALLFAVPCAKSDPLSIEKAEYLAMKTFANCIRDSNEYFPDKGRLLCGVLAQSKSQIIDYLLCPELKKFKPDRIRQFGNVDERILIYICSKSRWIEIAISKKSQEFVVISIGESLH